MQHWAEKGYVIPDQCYTYIVARHFICRTNKLTFCMIKPLPSVTGVHLKVTHTLTNLQLSETGLFSYMLGSK